MRTTLRDYNNIADSRDEHQHIMAGLHSRAIRVLSRPANSTYGTGVLTNFTALASYGFTDSPSPTILVPGSPPILEKKEPRFTLPRDSGSTFVDETRYRVPEFPLLPLLVAVDHLHPNYDFSPLHFVTDRNSLRKLLRWIDGSTSDRPFRIDMQLAGHSTVLFNRNDKVTGEFHEFSGYGKNFEQAMTRPGEGCESQTSHRRIVTYNFGHLKMMVRFEVDAYFEDEVSDGGTDTPPDTSGLSVDYDDLYELSSALENLTMDKMDRPQLIDVVDVGRLVPQESIVEMTTRNQYYFEKDGEDFLDYYPQLWFSQTPLHLLGLHRKGVFGQLRYRRLNGPAFKGVERLMQPSFDKLCSFLTSVKDIMLKAGEHARFSLVFQDGQMKICSRKAMQDMLPEYWMKRFVPPQTRSTRLSSEEEEGHDDFGGDGESLHIAD